MVFDTHSKMVMSPGRDLREDEGEGKPQGWNPFSWFGPILNVRFIFIIIIFLYLLLLLLLLFIYLFFSFWRHLLAVLLNVLHRKSSWCVHLPRIQKLSASETVRVWKYRGKLLKRGFPILCSLVGVLTVSSSPFQPNLQLVKVIANMLVHVSTIFVLWMQVWLPSVLHLSCPPLNKPKLGISKRVFPLCIADPCAIYFNQLVFNPQSKCFWMDHSEINRQI